MNERVWLLQGDGREPTVVPLLVLIARQLGILARTHPPTTTMQPSRPLKATADLYDKCCSTLQQVSWRPIT